jgi:predicted ATPase/DNA-binding CsgD family transcriptional regulator
MRQLTTTDDDTTATLPTPLTPIIGREREIALAADLLVDPRVRLVTLTGPGGVGKTRLAYHLAGIARRGAIHYLPLAAVRDPAHVLPAIAHALGLQGTDERPLTERLARLLEGGRLLLVLDNFEQVIAAAPAIASLLRAYPSVTALVTSRAPLRITGEHELEVRPLAVPDPARLPPAEAILRADAVALFLARVAAVRPGYTPGADELPAIVEICARLDGLPLALELAATRCRVLAPADLLAHLSHRLHLLTDGPRDLPARLRTMRDAIAWSHALLTPREQARFRRLSVFVGGFTIEAAEALAGAPVGEHVQGVTPSLEVLDDITALADQSLLQRADGPLATSRLEMLETIREYGLELLAASGEGAAVRERHAGWCVNLAGQGQATFWGTSPGNWRALLEPEHGNLRAAFAWLLDHGEPARALRLATDLEPFWWILGHGAEGLDWLHRALARAQDAPAGLRAEALSVAARLAERERDYAAARALAGEALALARRHGDDAGVARAIDMQAHIALQTGEMDAARPLVDDAIARYRHLGDRGRLAWALCDRGAMPVPNDPDDWILAIACCTEALAIFQDLDLQVGIGRAFHGLADLALDAGHALAKYQESIPYLWAAGASSGLASSLEGIAAMAHRLGHTMDAARLLGASAAIRDACAVYRAPNFIAWRPIERAIAGMRTTLGDEAFASAHAAGRVMPPDRFLALAMQPFAPDRSARIADLTARQREILERLADGQGNREIADALYLSVRTVEDHVSNLLERLGVASRAEAAALVRGTGSTLPRPPDGPVA